MKTHVLVQWIGSIHGPSVVRIRSQFFLVGKRKVGQVIQGPQWKRTGRQLTCIKLVTGKNFCPQPIQLLELMIS